MGDKCKVQEAIESDAWIGRGWLQNLAPAESK